MLFFLNKKKIIIILFFSESKHNTQPRGIITGPPLCVRPACLPIEVYAQTLLIWPLHTHTHIPLQIRGNIPTNGGYLVCVVGELRQWGVGEIEGYLSAWVYNGYQRWLSVGSIQKHSRTNTQTSFFFFTPSTPPHHLAQAPTQTQNIRLQMPVSNDHKVATDKNSVGCVGFFFFCRSLCKTRKALTQRVFFLFSRRPLNVL